MSMIQTYTHSLHLLCLFFEIPIMFVLYFNRFWDSTDFGIFTKVNVIVFLFLNLLRNKQYTAKVSSKYVNVDTMEPKINTPRIPEL